MSAGQPLWSAPTCWSFASANLFADGRAQRGGAEQLGAAILRRVTPPRRQVAAHESWNKFQQSKAAAPRGVGGRT